MELIDKSVIVAVIKKKLDKYSKLHSFNYGAVKDLESLLDFLDTLEVKEANLDFEQELYKAFGQVKDFTLGMRIAKHFYELGIKAKKGE